MGTEGEGETAGRLLVAGFGGFLGGRFRRRGGLGFGEGFVVIELALRTVESIGGAEPREDFGLHEFVIGGDFFSHGSLNEGTELRTAGAAWAYFFAGCFMPEKSAACLGSVCTAR